MAGSEIAVDLTPDTKVKHLTYGSEIYSTSKLSSVLGNIQANLAKLMLIVQNIDLSGNFYMPIGIKNGLQRYRKITTYVEPETDVTLPDISTATYIRTATGEFQEVNNA